MIDGSEANVAAVADYDAESGVDHGAELLAFTDAVMQGTSSDIDEARTDLAAMIGDSAVTDTGAVIAMFNIMDRIADATGIPIDEGPAHDARYQIGERIGMGHLTPEERARQ